MNQPTPKFVAKIRAEPGWHALTLCLDDDGELIEIPGGYLPDFEPIKWWGLTAPETGSMGIMTMLGYASGPSWHPLRRGGKPLLGQLSSIHEPGVTLEEAVAKVNKKHGKYADGTPIGST